MGEEVEPCSCMLSSPRISENTETSGFYDVIYCPSIIVSLSVALEYLARYSCLRAILSHVDA